MLSSLLRVLLLALTGTFAPSLQAALFGYSFPGAKPEELAMEAPKLDPEAGAEYLERSIRLIDQENGRHIHYYARVKIFTEAAVDAFNEFELESWKDYRVTKVHAQVTFPDGTTQESERDSIFRREVWRRGRERGDLTSVAIPGVKPGCIVELHYLARTREFDEFWAYAYHTLPTHHFRLRVQYYEFGQGGFTYAGFSKDAIENTRHHTEFNLYDLPAASDEPFAPTRGSVMPWMLIYYLPRYMGRDLSGSYWKKVADAVYDWQRKAVDARDRTIREKAEALTADAGTDEERLRALYDFCRTSIQNVYSDQANLSEREIDELDMPDDPAETLELGYGTGVDRMALFTSLAQAIGFDARFAVCSDRSLIPFSEQTANLAVTPDRLVAVRRDENEDWRFFDLRISHLPFGMLHWSNQGATALPSDRRGNVDFVKTPLDRAEVNEMQRFAFLKMDAEGNLSGTVRFYLKGQPAWRWRHLLDGQTESQREESLKNYLEETFSDFSLSEFKISHLFESEEPLQFDFELELPAYGLSAGSRLFICPAVFEPESSPLFESPTRVQDVHFSYPWQVTDKVVIDYPEGFVWAEDSPYGGFGELEGMHHFLRYWHDAEKRRLTFQRQLKIDLLGFQATHYELMKNIFDKINELDRYPLTLKVVAGEEAP